MNTDNQFRPAAFWFWHYLPEEIECLEVLQSARRAGLGCVLIQARLSMPWDDYLTPTYLARCAYVGEQAKDLGLSVEIYDEYNWMSGHGGGATVKGADHLRERHLFWCKGRSASDNGRYVFTISSIHSSFLDFLGPEGALWCNEQGVARWGDWQVQGFVRNGEVLAPYELIVEPGENGCTVSARFEKTVSDEGEITLLLSARSFGSRLVNYLLPEMAERFVEKVYGPLLDVLPSADGFFFDHPYAGFQDWTERCGFVGNSVLWDEDLFARGITLQHLAALAEEDDEKSSRLRLEFFRIYSSCMHEAFFGTLSRWCAERGVGLSGHELLPHVGAWSPRKGLGGIDPRVMPGTDHFAVDRYRTATTVDAADYVPQLSVILGDSVARANGRSRCTVEQYSTGREVGRASLLGQWDLTPARLRTQSLRHLLCGARRILLHALYLPGVVKRTPSGMFDPVQDFPPGFNLQPWWEHMDVLSNELFEVSKFLEEGEPVRSVALLYPLADLWAGPVDATSAHLFGAWAQALDEAGCPFVIIDESQLVRGEIEAGITTVILPGVGWLEHAASFAALQAFGEQKGHEILASAVGGAALVPLCGAEPSGGSWGLENVLRGVKEDAIAEEAWRLAAGLRNVARLSSPDQLGTIPSDPAQKLPLSGRIAWHHVSDSPPRDRLAVQNEIGQWRELILGASEKPRHLRGWEAAPAKWVQSAAERAWRSWGTIPAGEAVAIRVRPHEMLCLEWEEGVASGALEDVLEWMPFPQGPMIQLTDGWQFAEDALNVWQPVTPTLPLEEQGMGADGSGIYQVDLSSVGNESASADVSCRWHLVIPKVRGTLECRIDDVPCGVSLTDQAVFPCPKEFSFPSGVLQLIWRGTAANRFYKDHSPVAGERREKSGLMGVPRLELWRLQPRVRRIKAA
ncbi:hypothetical protein [Acetobacter sp.]|uniref:hypothetical protein n=1 Tax=Acetobacter sp. TaxID=440 RepID=UPI0039EBC335